LSNCKAIWTVTGTIIYTSIKNMCKNKNIGANTDLDSLINLVEMSLCCRALLSTRFSVKERNLSSEVPYK